MRIQWPGQGCSLARIFSSGIIKIERRESVKKYSLFKWTTKLRSYGQVKYGYVRYFAKETHLVFKKKLKKWKFKKENAWFASWPKWTLPPMWGPLQIVRKWKLKEKKTEPLKRKSESWTCLVCQPAWVDSSTYVRAAVCVPPRPMGRPTGCSTAMERSCSIISSYYLKLSSTITSTAMERYCLITSSYHLLSFLLLWRCRLESPSSVHPLSCPLILRAMLSYLISSFTV